MSFICAHGHHAPDGSRSVTIATTVREVAYRVVGGHFFDNKSGLVRAKFERTSRGSEVAEVKIFCTDHIPGEDFEPQVIRDMDPETGEGTPFLREQILDPLGLADAQELLNEWKLAQDKAHARRESMRVQLREGASEALKTFQRAFSADTD